MRVGGDGFSGRPVPGEPKEPGPLKRPGRDFDEDKVKPFPPSPPSPQIPTSYKTKLKLLDDIKSGKDPKAILERLKLLRELRAREGQGTATADLAIQNLELLIEHKSEKLPGFLNFMRETIEQELTYEKEVIIK